MHFLPSVDFEDGVGSIEQAEERLPQCAIVVDVDGGFAGFETVTEYDTWMAQK